MNPEFVLVFDSGAWFVRARDQYGTVNQVAGPCPTLEAAIVEASLRSGGPVAIRLVAAGDANL